MSETATQGACSASGIRECNRSGMARSLYGIRTAIWEMWAEFRHEWKRITIASIISPLMYMIALGWGLGSMVNTGDRPYIDFLVI